MACAIALKVRYDGFSVQRSIWLMNWTDTDAASAAASCVSPERMRRFTTALPSLMSSKGDSGLRSATATWCGSTSSEEHIQTLHQMTVHNARDLGDCENGEAALLERLEARSKTIALSRCIRTRV
jgi:hypothetical protein